MPEWHVMAQEPQVLVIDDETGSRESMAIAIETAGFVVRPSTTPGGRSSYLEETEAGAAGGLRPADAGHRRPGVSERGPQARARPRR